MDLSLFLDYPDILFNILLNVDINTISNMIEINKFQNICDKHFWLTKFKHDDLFIIKEKDHSIYWIKEYKIMTNCTNNTNNLIHESVNHFDMYRKDKSVNNPNYDGVIVVNFNDDCRMRYGNINDITYLPRELNVKILNEFNQNQAKNSKLKKYVDAEFIPSMLIFQPKSTNKYKLKYCVIRQLNYENGDETEEFDFTIEIDKLKMKEILINAMYDNVNYIKHKFDYDNDPYK